LQVVFVDALRFPSFSFCPHRTEKYTTVCQSKRSFFPFFDASPWLASRSTLLDVLRAVLTTFFFFSLQRGESLSPFFDASAFPVDMIFISLICGRKHVEYSPVAWQSLHAVRFLSSSLSRRPLLRRSPFFQIVPPFFWPRVTDERLFRHATRLSLICFTSCCAQSGKSKRVPPLPSPLSRAMRYCSPSPNYFSV